MYELRVIRERRRGYSPSRTVLTTARAVADGFRAHFVAVDREHFLVVLLDAKNRPLGFHTVSVGCLTASLVHPREVFKAAILANAAAIIAIHNHPSGDPAPSAEDGAITGQLADAGRLLGIRLVDHVILGDDGAYFSFSEATDALVRHGNPDGENADDRARSSRAAA